jgi:hypothetical protein
MAEEDILQAKYLPTFHGRDYKPGAAYDSKIVCDYAHDTRCDGSCLPWNDEWLQGDLYPHAMTCFPNFDLVYGNCSLDRTMYENCAIQHPHDSYITRIELEEHIGRRLSIQTREDHYSQEKEEVVGRRNTSEEAISMSYFDHEARQRKGGVLAGQ